MHNRAPKESVEGAFRAQVDRSASWLLSPYEDDQWTVVDIDGANPKCINFMYRMSDGRYLPEWHDFYQSVKEYAWWSRDEVRGYINDSMTHVSRVIALMSVVHSLSYRGVASLNDVRPHHIDRIVERASWGAEGVLEGRSRIIEYLDGVEQEARRAEDCDAPLRDRGLPRYVLPNGKVTDRIATSEVVARANLPDSTIRLNRVIQPIAVAAERAGLRCQGRIDEVAPQRLTETAMTRIIDPLQHIYWLRNVIRAASLPFNPFPDGVYAAVRPYGLPVKRTPTPSPPAALGLLQQAVVWVTAYGTSVLDLEEACHDSRGNPYYYRVAHLNQLSLRIPTSGVAGSPWPCTLRRDSVHDELTLFHVVKYLVSACWIVLATFTGRRLTELDRLKVDALHGSDRDGWWIRCYIAKTLKREEDIPVPNVAARAMELLARLSARARSARSDDHVFYWMSPFSDKDEPDCIQLDPSASLDDFARHVSPAMSARSQEANKGWHWTAHQFRRFFAIMYFYIYEDSSLEVLSHHLRHFSLQMTRVYLTRDPEQVPIWLDAEWAYRGDIARAAVAHERTLGGPMGARLRKVARRFSDVLRRRLSVVSPERVSAHVGKFMHRQGLVLMPKPWVTCSCPSSQAGALSARCRRGVSASACVIGPDTSRAGPDVCANCPWAITSPTSRRRVGETRDKLELAVSMCPDGQTVVDILNRARLAELVSAESAEAMQDGQD